MLIKNAEQKRSRVFAECVSMSLICFRCLRTRDHVSDWREFQKYPLLAEGFHVHCGRQAEPPVKVRRHVPVIVCEIDSSVVFDRTLSILCIRFE